MCFRRGRVIRTGRLGVKTCGDLPICHLWALVVTCGEHHGSLQTVKLSSSFDTNTQDEEYKDDFKFQSYLLPLWQNKASLSSAAQF